MPRASSGCRGALLSPGPGTSCEFSFLQSKHTHYCHWVPGTFVGAEGHGCALFHSNAQELRAVQGCEWSCQGPCRCVTTVIMGDSAGWCAEQGGPRACGRAAQSDAVRCWGRGPHGWASPSPGPGVTRPRQDSWKKQRPRGAVSWARPSRCPPHPPVPRPPLSPAFSPFPVTPALS